MCKYLLNQIWLLKNSIVYLYKQSGTDVQQGFRTTFSIRKRENLSVRQEKQCLFLFFRSALRFRQSAELFRHNLRTVMTERSELLEFHKYSYPLHGKKSTCSYLLDAKLPHVTQNG